MIKFTRDQKAEAFDNLPKDLKAVIMSNALVNAFQEIGTQNRLPLDKTGILSELVTLTMLGLLPREELQNNIQKELGIDGLQASTITKSVNENIFLKIRDILQQEEGEEEKKDVATTSAEESAPLTDGPSKDEILSEIENPTPSVHPISIVDQTIPGPAKPREIVAEPKPAETKESVAHDFIAGKMTETVSLPSQRIDVSPEKPAEKPIGYAADPYREPIN